MLRSLITLLCVAASALYAGGPGVEAAPAGADAGPLGFFYDLYTFRGDAGRTRVVAAFAVPAGRLEERWVRNQVRYRFDVSLVIADTARQNIVRTDDSVFVAATGPLAGEHLLFTQVELRAPPSVTTVQRVTMTDASTPGKGQLYDAHFPIPDYGGSDLMLSDIALGDPDVEGGWKRGDVSLAIFPTSQFPESAFDVYYEIYNLPRGHRYTTEIAVQPVDGAGRPMAGDDAAIRLRFSAVASLWSDGWLQELRRVQAALDRGRYGLTVTITNEETGESASRSRIFQVRGWRPGATMVAARPRRAPRGH